MQREEIYAALPGALLPWCASHARDFRGGAIGSRIMSGCRKSCSSRRASRRRGVLPALSGRVSPLRDLAAADEQGC